jgi:hypothetical protein
MIYLQNTTTKEIAEFINEDTIGLNYVIGWQPATKEEITAFLFKKGKQSKLAEIKAKRDEILNKTESIIFDGKTYKINDNIRRLYQDKYNIGVFPIDWRCIDDITWVSLINTKALQLLNSFIDFCENKNTTIYQKETTFIIALNNAKSPDDINKIIVNY